MSVQQKQIKIAITWVAVLLVVATVGFTVWFAYHSNQVASRTLQSANQASSDIPKLPAVNSFDACKKSPGSMILQTYPEQCVTKTGQKFTASPTAAYLTIKEWGVRMPLGRSDLADAEYTLSSDGKRAHITTKTLAHLSAQLGGCHPGIDDVYVDRSTTTASFANSWKPQKIGQYYYGPAVLIEPLCVTQGGNSKDLATMQTIQTDLEQAASQIAAAP
ncbi:MAG TPA: hypothetical protein VLE99_04210 [Candidatus Saccharimonadales bacterium]|nr:hypothetical protein [Candidatus Saccharimonadales bacterium]